MMTPTDIIALAILLFVVGSVGFYIIRTKRRGQRCIGCPDAKSCSGNCSHCHACPSQKETEYE